jgi:hypothetical protein
MPAEMTLCSGICLGIQINRVVWAGLHARLAPDANGRIELDNAVIALIHCVDRTDAHAGWVGAMVATRYLKTATHIGILARLNIFDPCAIHAERHLILGFARGTTGVTSDALALVNKKPVICH